MILDVDVGVLVPVATSEVGAGSFEDRLVELDLVEGFVPVAATGGGDSIYCLPVLDTFISGDFAARLSIIHCFARALAAAVIAALESSMLTNVGMMRRSKAGDGDGKSEFVQNVFVRQNEL